MARRVQWGAPAGARSARAEVERAGPLQPGEVRARAVDVEVEDKDQHKARFGSHVDPALRDGAAPTEAELLQLLNEKADQLLPE